MVLRGACPRCPCHSFLVTGPLGGSRGASLGVPHAGVRWVLWLDLTSPLEVSLARAWWVVFPEQIGRPPA